MRSEELYVSVSQLKSFLLCSRAFEFRYVLGATPEHVPVPLAFGIAIHAALACHVSVRWTAPRSPARA